LSEFKFTDSYYDRHWSLVESLSLQEEERIRQTISLIPEDVSSILDVGCGDGRITNCLVPRCSRVTGLERSEEALRHVKTEKILGSIDSLPFQDRSFDLVFCCEVLEHLPFTAYAKALAEIEKVATKYIIVTVPNNEDIGQALVTCPHCGCVFHPWGHLRRFRLEDMANLFDEFSVQVTRLYQPRGKVYPSFMIKIGKLLKLVPAFPADALCPQM